MLWQQNNLISKNHHLNADTTNIRINVQYVFRLYRLECNNQRRDIQATKFHRLQCIQLTFYMYRMSSYTRTRTLKSEQSQPSIYRIMLNSKCGKIIVEIKLIRVERIVQIYNLNANVIRFSFRRKNEIQVKSFLTFMQCEHRKFIEVLLNLLLSNLDT